MENEFKNHSVKESQLKEAIYVYFLKILVWSKMADNGFV